MKKLDDKGEGYPNVLNGSLGNDCGNNDMVSASVEDVEKVAEKNNVDGENLSDEVRPPKKSKSVIDDKCCFSGENGLNCSTENVYFDDY